MNFTYNIYIDWQILVLLFLLYIFLTLSRIGSLLYRVYDTNYYMDTKKSIFLYRTFTFNLWTTLPFIVLTYSLRSLEFSVLSGSILWSNNFTKLLLIISILNVIQPLTILFKNNWVLNSWLNWGILMPLVSTILNLALLFIWNVTSLIPFIISIEILNTIILAISVICLYGIKIKAVRLSSLVTLFWVNTFASFLLFLILNLELSLNIESTDYILIGIYSEFNANTFTGAWPLEYPSYTLLNLFLLLVFFFKLSLPPFIYWKIVIFENSNLYFIITYNLPFFFSNFTYLLYLLSVLKVFTNPTSLNFIILLTTSSLFSIFLIYKYVSTLGTFLAISGGLSGIFLFLIFLLMLQNLSLGDSNLIRTYIAVYSLYLAVYVISAVLLTLVYVNFKFQDGSNLLTFNFNYYKTYTISFISKITLAIIWSLAGIPPFLSFFFKLLLVNLINISKMNAAVILPSLVFLVFVTLVFYIKITRFLLIQTTNHFLNSKPQVTKLINNDYFFEIPSLFFVTLVSTVLFNYGFLIDLIFLCVFAPRS